MEATICNGSKSVLLQLIQMHCAWHLQVRDEKKINNCHQKIFIPDKLKVSYKSEIVCKIYGKQITAAFYKDFKFKPFLFESSLKAVFFRVSWLVFDSTLKRVLETFSPHTAGMNIDGLYNQNDVESLQQFR